MDYSLIISSVFDGGLLFMTSFFTYVLFVIQTCVLWSKCFQWYTNRALTPLNGKHTGMDDGVM